MVRNRVTFADNFRKDLSISMPLSAIAAVGLARMYAPPFLMQLALSVAAALWSGLVFAAVLAAAQTYVLPRLRFPSFLLAVLVVSLTYLAVILIAIPLSIAVSVSLAIRIPPWRPEPWEITARFLSPTMVLVAFALMVAITFAFMVSKKLGRGVLLNWMLGRYYRPREEERVFMFIDLRDSTPLGEQLGDLRFSRLIQMFFADISGPILATKGEVSHYIGDEAVVCWPMSRGLKDANCLSCFFLAQDAVEDNRELYLKEFGLVPGFKAGAHLGSVVATQVGEIKSEIVFHGDVLNTTARIQGACNDAGADFLVSEALVQALGPSSGFEFTDIGPQELKGKGQDVRLYSVSRRASSIVSSERA